MRKFLFIMRYSPWPGVIPGECLDMAMTVAAFDQAVSLLFLDDGVLQLQTGQIPPAGYRGRVLNPVWDALELYDITTLWVEQESLRQRGLDATRLLRPIQLIRRPDVPDLIAAHDRVVSG